MTITDYLEPKLASLQFTADEKAAIETALNSTAPWDHEAQSCKMVRDHLAAIKNKLRAFHMQRQDNDCAYCKVSLAGRAGVSIDREHILPKGKYTAYTYEAFNLSVACKRCNMDIKKERCDFLANASDGQHLQASENYLIVHPNFDDWYKHLCIESVRIGRVRIFKYLVNGKSTKAVYTYSYFKLQDLEEDTFDQAQGLPRPTMRTLEDVFAEYSAEADTIMT